MQIHELPTLPSSDGSEYMAVDTGSATYKMKTLFGAISSTVLKIFGSLVVNGGLGTGGKTGYNDTTHPGTWISSGGEVHLSKSDTGGLIGFHFGMSGSSTTSLYERESGLLRCTQRFECKDYSDGIRTPVSSAGSDGGKVGWCQSMASALRVSGQWGVSGGSFGTNDIPVSSSDIRLKENIQDCEVNALDVVKAIKMRSFDWNNGRGHQDIGMVADEIESLDARLTLGGGEDEDGNPIYKSVDTFYLVGYLVKAVQELSAEVERLRG